MAIYEVACRVAYAGPGSPGANVWHVRTDATVLLGDLDLAQAIGAIAAFYQANEGNYPNSCTITVADSVTRIDGAEPETAPFPPVLVSGVAESELPERLAILVKLQTERPGRSGRGRKFIGPLGANTLESNGTVVELTRENMQTALDTLIDASTDANGWAIGVYSKLSNTLADVVSGFVENEFAQLSSRRF